MGKPQTAKPETAPVGERRVGRTIGAVLGWVLALMALLAPSAVAQLPTENDPRVGLTTGQQEAPALPAGAWTSPPI